MDNELLESAVKLGKEKAKQELESLIEQCYREIRNLERFNDERMIPATADLKYHFDQVEEKAGDLEDALNDLEWANREGGDEDMRGPDRDEWRHEAEKAQRLK